MPASGDDDSPMANRGWRPRSSSATRSPRRRAIIARIEPPKPEPTIARSTSGTAHTPRAPAPAAPGSSAAAARHGPASSRSRTAARCPRDRRTRACGGRRRAPPAPPIRDRADPAAVATPTGSASMAPLPPRVGNHGTDRGAHAAGGADRVERPVRGVVVRHEGRVEQDEHPERDAVARQERRRLGGSPRRSSACADAARASRCTVSSPTATSSRSAQQVAKRAGSASP